MYFISTTLWFQSYATKLTYFCKRFADIVKNPWRTPSAYCPIGNTFISGVFWMHRWPATIANAVLAIFFAFVPRVSVCFPLWLFCVSCPLWGSPPLNRSQSYYCQNSLLSTATIKATRYIIIYQTLHSPLSFRQCNTNARTFYCRTVDLTTD